MKFCLILLQLGLLLGFLGSSSAKADTLRRADFNSDWLFCLGDDSVAARYDYNDTGWRRLNLPHDWAIEGEFSKDNPSGTGGGALPGGIAC